MAKRLGVLSLLALVVTLALGAGTANAALGVCSGSGKLTAQNGTPATWQVSGKGSCFSAGQTRILSFSGRGTSNSLGLCTPDHLVVTNLQLQVKVVQTRSVTGRTTIEYQRWASPITLFPLATPFFVEGSGGAFRGVGISIHHIHLQ